MAVVIRVIGVLGASSRGHGTKERLRDRGLELSAKSWLFDFIFREVVRCVPYEHAHSTN